MKKQIVYCSCEEPVADFDLVREPLCWTCGYPVRYWPPGPVQDCSPTIDEPGPVPGWFTSPAAERGRRLARDGRRLAIDEMHQILEDPAANVSEPQRSAFAYGLERFEAIEAAEAHLVAPDRAAAAAETPESSPQRPQVRPGAPAGPPPRGSAAAAVRAALRPSRPSTPPPTPRRSPR